MNLDDRASRRGRLSMLVRAASQFDPPSLVGAIGIARAAEEPGPLGSRENCSWAAGIVSRRIYPDSYGAARSRRVTEGFKWADEETVVIEETSV